MANLTKEAAAVNWLMQLAWMVPIMYYYDDNTGFVYEQSHDLLPHLQKGKKYFLDGTESYLSFQNYAERIQRPAS